MQYNTIHQSIFIDLLYMTLNNKMWYRQHLLFQNAVMWYIMFQTERQKAQLVTGNVYVNHLEGIAEET